MYKPLPDGLIIQKSPIQGQGLFTTKFIEGNTNLGLGWIAVDDLFVDDEIVRTPLGGFINHSDEPNCIKIHSGTHYNLMTLRDIKAWEEITIKYTFYKV